MKSAVASAWKGFHKYSLRKQVREWARGIEKSLPASGYQWEQQILLKMFLLQWNSTMCLLQKKQLM